MASLLLWTEDLTKQYPRHSGGLRRSDAAPLAVDHLSLHVPAGAVYGLLGPNGAGKTTTLKLLTGLLRPTSGEIWMDGHAWRRGDLAHMGALIENPALYANLTAEENLRVHTLLLGLPRQRIREVLDIVHLSATGSKRAGQFSLGMKQRLGIALALLNRPRLLILDEPTNGLDPLGIQELRALVRAFPAQGITVLLSSHILAEVEQVATHVGIVNEGKLLYEQPYSTGTPLEPLFLRVLSQPAAQTPVSAPLTEVQHG